MKLAKKMLVSVLALAMVAALALTAFAAAPVISMTANEAIVGKTVTVNVAVDQWVGFESGDLVFNYDTDALKFVSIEQTGDYQTGDGDDVGEGEITWSFYYKNAATADNSKAICAITFEVLKAGEAVVTGRVDSWDGTEEATIGNVIINAKEPAQETTTAAPTTAAPTTAEPTTGGKGDIPQTGETGVAIIAGVMAVAAVAFVATRKKDEQ